MTMVSVEPCAIGEAVVLSTLFAVVKTKLAGFKQGLQGFRIASFHILTCCSLSALVGVSKLGEEERSDEVCGRGRVAAWLDSGSESIKDRGGLFDLHGDFGNQESYRWKRELAVPLFCISPTPNLFVLFVGLVGRALGDATRFVLLSVER